MKTFSTRRILSRLLVAVLCLGGPLAAWAAGRATATLSSEVMAQSDGVELSISVTGVRQLEPPVPPVIDGLEIRYSGNEQRTEVTNGRVESSVELHYTVQARRPGEFVIPSLEVLTDAGALRTAALKLSVRKDAPGEKTPAEVAEISVSKSSIYLGETVTVELRLLVDAETRIRLEKMPVLEGEGFTKQPFPRPREERARRGGRDYSVIVFRTAVSPGKAGKVTLGPSEISFAASVPRARRARSRDPFENFFNDPGSFFNEMQERTVTAPAVELEVKSLPAAGRPADFSGAVGQFQFSAEGSPKTVKLGDPVTMKMRISGRGNFDRVGAPVLADPTGWHAYPPSENFKPDDQLGVTGLKSFEVAVVPERKQTSMPVFQFSYFDPEEGKYVSLKSEAAPLMVTGEVPAPVAPAAPLVAEKATPTPAPAKAADIVGIKYELGKVERSFAPLYRSRQFWLAQGLPLLGLLALLGWHFSRKGEGERGIAALRKERGELWRTLRQGASHEAFYHAAARVLQIDTALALGLPILSVDPAAVKRTLGSDPQTSQGIDEIFAAHAELHYAGAGHSDGAVSAPERDRVLATLERAQKNHG